MPQLAAFRGALWDPSKVELAKVAGGPVDAVAGRLERGELVRDPGRALYRYHQVFDLGGRQVTRQMLVAAVRLAPWTEGTIRPHATTVPAARDAALAAITAGRAHTRPVLAGYRDAAREVDRLFRRIEDGAPTVEVTTGDGTLHRLWRVQSAEVAGHVRPLFAPKKLHVLDGHATYEAMLAYQASLGDALAPYSSGNYGLACLVNVEDPSLEVGPVHRIVRGEVARDAVLAAARAHFIVDKVPGAARDAARQHAALADTVAHQPAFLAIFAGDADAWKLTLSPDVSPTALGVEIHRALQKYDPVVVERLFLAKVLPAATVELAPDAAAVPRALEGGAGLALVLRPLGLDQLLHADELGQLLPAGAAAFRPPLASLVTYVVDPDEDLV